MQPNMTYCQCGGLKLQPGVTYGYAGPICYCTAAVNSQGLQAWTTHNSIDTNYFGLDRTQTPVRFNRTYEKPTLRQRLSAAWRAFLEG